MLHRALIDIRVGGATEHAGIPQDCRLLVKTLGITNNVKLSVLIHPDFSVRKFRECVETTPTLAAALLLNGSGKQYGNDKARAGRGIRRLLRRLRSKMGERSPYPIRPVDGAMSDAVWRTYLSPTLSHQDRALLGKTDIFISAIPENRMQRWRSWPMLKTSGFDFVIFPDLRSVTVSPGTTKIFRFHDALPIVASDMFQDRASVERQFKLLANGCRDSFLVCNSEPTRKQLLRLFPELEARSVVIPCTMPDFAVWKGSDIPLGRIVADRRAAHVGSRKPPVPPVLTEGQEFVLMVSTIEPRKNHLGAIDALDRVKRSLGRDIKLIIVGAPGWKDKPVLDEIARGVQGQSIIHLSRVPQEELVSLYQKASAVLFPSFAEGFGFAPLEAMQCGTPAVVSDVAAHRWVLGDAALYADPYDTAAIAHQLSLLLTDSNGEGLRRELRSKAANVLDRFTATTTSQQWSMLLDRLRSEQHTLVGSR